MFWRKERNQMKEDIEILKKDVKALKENEKRKDRIKNFNEVGYFRPYSLPAFADLTDSEYVKNNPPIYFYKDNIEYPVYNFHLYNEEILKIKFNKLNKEIVFVKTEQYNGQMTSENYYIVDFKKDQVIKSEVPSYLFTDWNKFCSK